MTAANIWQAIAAVVDYLEDDEWKDYEADPREGHIYESVKVLRDALDRYGEA
jgi:hypothetical protein